MLENGWDDAPYGTIGDKGTTKESWKQAILNLLNQKEAIGIFNPVMYDTPDNNDSIYITEACKELGFLMQRCFDSSTNNFLKTKEQYRTGATYLTNSSLNDCKSKVEEAIANNWGVVFYAHNMSDSSDLSAESFTNFIQYVNSKVQNGDLEVLSARDYVYKYLTDKAMSNDYKASVKLQAFLHV